MFNKLLKSLRKENHLKQKDIAKKLNISTGTIGNYEAGNREPDIKTLIKIANYFDVTVDYLIGHSPPTTTHTILNDVEKQIINDYRELPTNAKGYLLAYLKGLKDTTREYIKER